ncbi:MAG: Maf-like protein [Pseudomonadota bacterium]
MRPHLILASASPFRRRLLENAGIEFAVRPAQIDERAVEAPLRQSQVSAEDTALILAEAKALDVSEKATGALVIGSDQTLALGDAIFHKPDDMEGARGYLLKLSGKTHQLNTAVVIARDGETLWRHVATANLKMRRLDPGFIGRYLSRAGNDALKSVGAYQLEGLGAQLFERIEGDYFTIIGLPLLPLLEKLRELEAIDG